MEFNLGRGENYKTQAAVFFVQILNMKFKILYFILIQRSYFINSVKLHMVRSLVSMEQQHVKNRIECFPFI